MATAAERDRRQRRALALSARGQSSREVAARLGVSHQTVLRDLAAAPRPPLPRLSRELRQQVQGDHSQLGQKRRRRKVYQLHLAGAGVREIARLTGVSPATVSRDIRLTRHVLHYLGLRSRADVLQVIATPAGLFTVRDTLG